MSSSLKKKKRYKGEEKRVRGDKLAAETETVANIINKMLKDKCIIWMECGNYTKSEESKWRVYDWRQQNGQNYWKSFGFYVEICRILLSVAVLLQPFALELLSLYVSLSVSFSSSPECVFGVFVEHSSICNSIDWRPDAATVYRKPNRATALSKPIDFVRNPQPIQYESHSRKTVALANYALS